MYHDLSDLGSLILFQITPKNAPYIYNLKTLAVPSVCLVDLAFLRGGDINVFGHVLMRNEMGSLRIQ